MEFLRSLAPRHANDATRACAVLPSRFADMSPLRANPATPAPRPDELETVPQEIAIPSANAGRPPAAAPAAADRAVPVAARSSPGTRIASTSTDSTARTTLAPRADTRDSECSTAGQASRFAPTHAAARPVSRAAAVRDAGSPEAQVGASSPNAAPRHAPLSPQALAARTSHAAERRPVIHVTIDRIDVRAPAAPDRPKGSSRSRGASPSVSLADYLRPRESGRRRGGP
jgi:hypothetical protein